MHTLETQDKPTRFSFNTALFGFIASLSFSQLSTQMAATTTTTSLSINSRLTTRATGLKLASFSNQGRNTLSFGFRPLPAARLRVSCAAKPETVEKVCAIVKKQLALPADSVVNGESKFAALGADSLDTVEIVMGLEEEFGISVEEESAQSIATVQDAADLIEKLIEKKA